MFFFFLRMADTDTNCSIPAIPRSDRKISILARSIDAFDTVSYPDVVLLMWCVLCCVIELDNVLVNKLKTFTCLCC